MSSNIPQFRQYLNRIISNYDKYADTILEEICQRIVSEAQERLIMSGYNVIDLVDNITYQKYGKSKYRVGIRNNNAKDIMYFLEFGTGIVGQANKHPMANEIGWDYVMHPENIVYNKWSSGINSVGEYVGKEGWWYEVPSETEANWITEDGKMYAFTSGLKPVRYFFDTIKKENIDRIVQQVLLKYRNIE
jgi:hypothetical protein